MDAGRWIDPRRGIEAVWRLARNLARAYGPPAMHRGGAGSGGLKSSPTLGHAVTPAAKDQFNRHRLRDVGRGETSDLTLGIGLGDVHPKDSAEATGSAALGTCM